MGGALPSISAADLFSMINSLLGWAPIATYIGMVLALSLVGVLFAMLMRVFMRG